MAGSRLSRRRNSYRRGSHRRVRGRTTSRTGVRGGGDGHHPKRTEQDLELPHKAPQIGKVNGTKWVAQFPFCVAHDSVGYTYAKDVPERCTASQIDLTRSSFSTCECIGGTTLKRWGVRSALQLSAAARAAKIIARSMVCASDNRWLIQTSGLRIYCILDRYLRHVQCSYFGSVRPTFINAPRKGYATTQQSEPAGEQSYQQGCPWHPAGPGRCAHRGVRAPSVQPFSHPAGISTLAGIALWRGDRGGLNVNVYLA
jgi:hypothetical protein